jgi:hypothetical protein
VEELVTRVAAVTVEEKVSEEFSAARVAIEAAVQDIVDEADKTWVISQSLGEALVFEFFRGALPLNFEKSVAGRVFSAKGELRWVRDASGCRYWKTVEDGAAAEVGDDAPMKWRREDRRYFLWGMYTKEGTFSENRTVGDFRYDLPKDRRDPRIDDRAYVVVAEYRVGEPVDWATVKDVEAVLNQPEIVGHRYVSVGCGRSE